MESSTPVTLDVDELFADFEDAPAENAVDNVRDSSPPRHVEKIHRSDKILALKAESILMFLNVNFILFHLSVWKIF